MNRFFLNVGACSQAILLGLLLLTPTSALHAQDSCEPPPPPPPDSPPPPDNSADGSGQGVAGKTGSVTGAAATGTCKTQATEVPVLFKRTFLRIEKSGFFPYVMSGSDLPEKFTTEEWSGANGSVDAPSAGCHIVYKHMNWQGGWTFSTTDFTDTSTKQVEYDRTLCINDHVGPLTALKQGLGDSPGAIYTPAPTSVSASSRSAVVSDGDTQLNVTESLSGGFSAGQAIARGNATATVLDGEPRQFWNNWSPGSANEANTMMGQGLISRTSPVTAHANRVSFQAQLGNLPEGRYMLTLYYRTESLTGSGARRFKIEGKRLDLTGEPQPRRYPESEYADYSVPLEQGWQTHLYRATIRNAEECARRPAGQSSSANHSVDQEFSLGKSADGTSAGILTVSAPEVFPELYTPGTLQLIGGDQPDVEVIRIGDVLRQVNAPEALADIVTLSSSSYEIRFYLPSQVGVLTNGVHALTGQPYAVHRVDNPGGTNQIRFTEIRGSQQKVTIYTYDSGTGTMTMSEGNGLRIDAFQKVVAGSTTTETRTIRNAANQAVSVVRETKTTYPFGSVVTQRTLDPAGANLSSNYTYYTDAVNDGGGYGQIKLAVEPSGRWTRYAYDAQGRTISIVSQFLDTASNSADNLNRASTTTYGTIPDQDGDNVPEELITTVKSLLGQEVSRYYEVTYSNLGTAYGADMRTTRHIQCIAPGAAWNASTNLVTIRRTIQSGAWFGKIIDERRPDGTMTTHTYAQDASNLTVTTYIGAANAAGTAVVEGRRTVYVQTLLGKAVSSNTYDYPANTLVASELVSQTDSLGRPTRIEYLDGTFEVRSYACCGLDMVIDRQGITTNYLYNELGQVDRETRAGIAQERTLDPSGRLLSTKRIGTDNSEIITRSQNFDLAGRLLWSRDALNRQTSYSEVTDGNGHTIRTTTNPDGGTAISTYAKDGSLLSVTGTGAAQRLTYEYGVDADGIYTKEIHVGPNNETTEWVKTYTDFLGRPYKRVYADGAVETSYYNSAGQLERQVDADGVTTLFAYNGKGEQETTAVDLNGNNTIDYTVDRITRTRTDVATRGTYTVERATTESWETDGQETPIIVAVTETAVDALRSWQTNRGLLTSTVTTLNGSGGRTTVTTAPDGTTTTQTFADDRLSSLVTSHTALGSLASATYSYDAHGRLANSSQLSSLNTQLVTSYTYFNDDQIQSVTTPDPDTTRTGAGYGPQVTTFDYDGAGRQSQVTQPDATVVNTSYWPTGAVKRIWGSRTYPVEYTYDTQGRVKTLTTWKDFVGDTGTAVTTLNYTAARGFLQNKRYADNTGPTYAYKPSGRLLTRTWARGTVTTYVYNAAGDPNGVSYSDATSPVSITYDRSGRPKTTTDASGTRTLTYDASGQLKDEDYTAGLLNSLGVHRTFDSLSRLGSVSAISASSALNPVSYSYDAASRLNVVTAGASTATYAYLPNSPLVGSITFKQSGATRLTTTKAYDNLNRLSGITNTSSFPALPSVQYDYNAANQRTRATREDNAYWDYGYDALGQVSSATKKIASGDPVPGLDYSYTYDDIGNRKLSTLNSQLSTYTTNSLNQYSQKTVPGVIDVLGTAVTDATVTVNGQSVIRQGESWHRSVAIPNTTVSTWNEFTVAGVRPGQGPGGTDAVAVSKRKAWLPRTPEAFTYDADGNLVGDGRWTYTWDGENRLVAMETRADILPPFGNFPLTERRKLEFGYDAQGRRFGKKVSTWTGTAWQLVSSTHFVYDGWNLLADLNALNSNTAACTYVWGLDLSGSMQGAGGVGGLLFTKPLTSSSALHAPCYDGNGNIIGLVDLSTGAKSATYEYSAFGETLISDGVAAAANTFRFSTKYTDLETDLLYYGLRYYSPSTGRWLGRDPANEDGGSNLYVFADNSPLGAMDYLGLCKIEIRHARLGEIFGKAYYHAYVVTTEPDGSQNYFRGGPSAGGPSGGAIGAIASGGSGNSSGSASKHSRSQSSNSSNGSSPGSSPGGKDGNLGPWGAIVATTGSYVPGTIDWDPNPSPTVKVLDDCKPCSEYNQKLRYGLRLIENAKIPYNPFGDNSNATAYSIVEIAGFSRPTAPVWAPGSTHKLP